MTNQRRVLGPVSTNHSSPDPHIVHEPAAPAHEPVRHAALAVAHPVAECPVGDAAQHHVHQVLHHDVHLIRAVKEPSRDSTVPGEGPTKCLNANSKDFL